MPNIILPTCLRMYVLAAISAVFARQAPLTLRLPMPPPEFNLEKWRSSLQRMRELKFQAALPPLTLACSMIRTGICRLSSVSWTRLMSGCLPPCRDALTWRTVSASFMEWTHRRYEAEGATPGSGGVFRDCQSLLDVASGHSSLLAQAPRSEGVRIEKESELCKNGSAGLSSRRPICDKYSLPLTDSQPEAAVRSRQTLLGCNSRRRCWRGSGPSAGIWLAAGS